MQFTQSTLSADRKYNSVGHLLNEAGSNITNPLTQGGHACCICRSGVWFIACPFARPSVVPKQHCYMFYRRPDVLYRRPDVLYRRPDVFIQKAWCVNYIEGLMCLYRRPSDMIPQHEGHTWIFLSELQMIILLPTRTLFRATT